MKNSILKKCARLLATAAILFLFISPANPQTERRSPANIADNIIQVGTVTGKSPAVSLNAVSREVAPGMLEVDPGSIRGKRLALPRGEMAQRGKVCIGRWVNGECRGIYIEW